MKGALVIDTLNFVFGKIHINQSDEIKYLSKILW